MKSICGEGNTGMRAETAKGSQREAEVASTAVGGHLPQATSEGRRPQSPDE